MAVFILLLEEAAVLVFFLSSCLTLFNPSVFVLVGHFSSVLSLKRVQDIVSVLLSKFDFRLSGL